MSIKQNGGVFGRNPTFNDVTIEGQLTFDGDIDINSDLKVDGDLEVTGDAAIGTGFTPDTQLHVYSASDQVAKFESADQIADIALKDTGGTCYIRQSNGSLTFEADRAGASSNSRIFFKVDNQLAAHFTAVGNLAFESGKGIDFSATAGTGTSELLDDYEEGTWSPTLVGAVSAGSYSVAVEDSSCKYTKVGRQVTVTGRFTITVSSAGSNYAKIGGLPFATSATNAMAGAVRTKGIGLAAGTVSLCTLNPTSGSVSYFAIGQSIDNASSVLLDIAGISSTDQITVTLTYFI
tara:strand:- start:1984 stop:2859 length:876 start_codon:yes stop_codon:yes gene_type:complete